MFPIPRKIAFLLAAGMGWWGSPLVNRADSQGTANTQAKLIEDFGTARLILATHFMNFERNLGEARPASGERGVFEFVTPAPPGEGWHWFKCYGASPATRPLRFRPTRR